MALTVGVAIVLDGRGVIVVVTDLQMPLAPSKAIGKPLLLHRISLINTLLRGRRESSCHSHLEIEQLTWFLVLGISVDAFCSSAASLVAYILVVDEDATACISIYPSL